MNVMVWVIIDHRYGPDDLGFIPEFLNTSDPRPAKEQIDANYQHGGGWRSAKGFTLHKDGSLTYPGDPLMHPIAMTGLREEIIIMYPHSWIVIMQPDRSFEIARID